MKYGWRIALICTAIIVTVYVFKSRMDDAVSLAYACGFTEATINKRQVFCGTSRQKAIARGYKVAEQIQ